MAHLMPEIFQQFLDANGVPLAGGKLFSYEAGTSTPLATFADATESAPNTNPVILDSNGVAQVWLGPQAYKLVLTDADDVVQWTADQVAHIINGSVTADKLASNSVTTLKIADGAVTTPKIANLAVETAKLGNSAVTAAKIATDAVETAKIKDANVTTVKIADSAITTAKINDGAITSAKIPDSTVLEMFLGRNKLINADFFFWQRGTTFTSIASGAYGPDRWLYNKSGAMIHDVSLSSDVPDPANSGILFANSTLIGCSTTDTSIAAGDFTTFGQKIEGYTFKAIAQRKFTMSFWVKASKTGIYCVSFRNRGNDRSYVAEYTVNASNVWEKKSVTVAASPSAGTWNYAALVGLDVSFALVAGTTYQTTKDAWQTGNFLATANQVNACDSTLNTFRVTGIQIEEGERVHQFESRSLALEDTLVKRYYENVQGFFRGYNPNVAATGALGGWISFSVSKRASPSVNTFGFTNLVLASNPTIANSTILGINVSSDFISGSAGTATFECFVNVGSEL